MTRKSEPFNSISHYVVTIRGLNVHGNHCGIPLELNIAFM
jgi:hypothetical protein